MRPELPIEQSEGKGQVAKYSGDSGRMLTGRSSAEADGRHRLRQRLQRSGNRPSAKKSDRTAVYDSPPAGNNTKRNVSIAVIECRGLTWTGVGDTLFLIVIPAQAGIQEPTGMEARMDKQPCVYLLAGKRNGTLYVGVTSNLIKRVWEHKEHLSDGFIGKYRVSTLVWYESHDTMETAIRREKQIKKWNRAWKIRLIELENPAWLDLYPHLL